MIAGIFNYIRFSQIEEIAQELSKEFGEVMWFSMDDESTYDCGVFRDGEALE